MHAVESCLLVVRNDGGYRVLLFCVGTCVVVGGGRGDLCGGWLGGEGAPQGGG